MTTTNDEMRMQFFHGVMALGRMEHHLSANSTTPADSMQWMEKMMGGGMPTTAASPTRKKKKKRSSPASPSATTTTSPKKKKRLSKVEQKKKKKMQQQAKAEAVAEAKAARPVSKWNFFLKCCTLFGNMNEIPTDTVKTYTEEMINKGKVNFNDDLARSNLLRKILGPIYKKYSANVTELYDLACDAANCSDGKIQKQDCDRIVTEEWLTGINTDLSTELFEASKAACSSGPVEEEVEEEVEEGEDDEEDSDDSDSDDSE